MARQLVPDDPSLEGEYQRLATAVSGTYSTFYNHTKFQAIPVMEKCNSMCNNLYHTQSYICMVFLPVFVVLLLFTGI